ncbi:glycoside hydrolase family 32 protein [Microbacterium sp. B2969]|uniref:beta-fructofuranosidase n=1 Tax=Microbacterium alkaliflavum TaxID=3248839 RepID=A0ABW7QDY0_9MICO
MRPALHFTPREGWINDPHGITYRDGRYHVFFQYVPGQTRWGPNCHWGHAVGPDLLSLTELPVAIAPGDGDDGIWTGCLVTDHDRRARIFYTSITTPDFGLGRVRVATPTGPDWLDWNKGDVVVDAPEGLDLIAYRDPFIRKERDGWRMFVGTAMRDGTAAALTYTSDDLDSWHYAGVALQRSTAETDPVWMGALWECPQVFAIGDRAVMVSSVWDDDVLHYAGYALGSYTDGVFHAEAWGRLTYGDSYYAPSLFLDADDRPCLLFWMRGIRDEAAGWAGAHSVPYLLSLDGDRLVARVHPDLEAHRAGVAPKGEVDGEAADIAWSDGLGGELTIASDDETVVLRWDAGALVVRCASSAPDAPAVRVPVEGAVRVVVDGPVLEVSSAAGLLGVPTAPFVTPLRIGATRGALQVHALS